MFINKRNNKKSDFLNNQKILGKNKIKHLN